MCVLSALSECARFSTNKSHKYKHQNKFSPKFQTDLPVMFQELNKVELDLLRKEITLLDISYLKSTTYRSTLFRPTNPGVHRHKGYLCMLQLLFSFGNIPRTFNVLLIAWERIPACIAFCIL